MENFCVLLFLVVWLTIQSEERQLQDKIAEDSKSMEHYATKKSLLLKKQEQCMKKIRELGSLPSDTFSKYQKTSVKEVGLCAVHTLSTGTDVTT